MKRMLSVLGLSIALSVGTAAFAQTEGHNHASQSNQSQPKVTKSDGSMVEIVIAPDGTKTEVRTFKTGDIARITRTTQSNGTRAVIVEYRDGRKADLTDENDIEQAMDATADTIIMAADKALSVTKTAGEEVADKTEDVADKTVDVSKKVGEKTKDAAKKTVDVAKTVGEKTGDVAEKAYDKTKEAGKEVADKTEDVADKTVDVGKDVVDKTGKVAVKGVKVTKEAGKEVADKSEDVADKAVDVGKDVADKTEDVADKTATQSVSWTKKVGRGFKRVGGWFKSVFD